LQQDKNEVQSVNSPQKVPVYRLGQHSISVVFTQISLRKINSFAFHFLFSELGMQIFGERHSIRAVSTILFYLGSQIWLGDIKLAKFSSYLSPTQARA
jgi:hypothetical protein